MPLHSAFSLVLEQLLETMFDNPRPNYREENPPKPQNRPKIPARHPNFRDRKSTPKIPEKYPQNTKMLSSEGASWKLAPVSP